jgi:hypothetical protein
MSSTRPAPLIGLFGLVLTTAGCFAPDDRGDAQTQSSTSDETGNTSAAGSGETSTSTTDDASTTKDEPTTANETDGSSTTTSSCAPSDECTENADCEAEGATCEGCMCVGGIACAPGMCGTACEDCDACTDCAVLPGAECGDEAMTCENNVHCNAAHACALACPTDDDIAFLQCFSGCLNQYPDGEADFMAFWNCIVGTPEMPGVCRQLCT